MSYKVSLSGKYERETSTVLYSSPIDKFPLPRRRTSNKKFKMEKSTKFRMFHWRSRIFRIEGNKVIYAEMI